MIAFIVAKAWTAFSYERFFFLTVRTDCDDVVAQQKEFIRTMTRLRPRQSWVNANKICEFTYVANWNITNHVRANEFPCEFSPQESGSDKPQRDVVFRAIQTIVSVWQRPISCSPPETTSNNHYDLYGSNFFSAGPSMAGLVSSKFIPFVFNASLCTKLMRKQ